MGEKASKERGQKGTHHNSTETKRRDFQTQDFSYFTASNISYAAERTESSGIQRNLLNCLISLRDLFQQSHESGTECKGLW